MSDLLSPLLTAQFWAQVHQGVDDDCWEWEGPRWERTDYGRVGIAAALPTTRAHRLAFGLTHGYLPPVVRHSCDNPPCCNPAHLLAGTQRDNIRDMHMRGRFRGGQRPGSRNINAKITEDDVRVMRAMRADGVMVKDIAEHFNVSRGNASKIVTGKIWTHVEMKGV